MRNHLIWMGLLLAWMWWGIQGLFPLPVSQASASLPAGIQQAQVISDLPMPDLQTLPPFDLQLIVQPSTGTRKLRFSNSVANTGAGPLHLIGEMDANNQTVTLIQQVRGPNDRLVEQHLGGFAYHPEHGHWHWQGFSVYEIWSLGLNAVPERIMVNSGKVGYCMLDSNRADARWLLSVGLDTLAPVTNRGYSQCGWRRQGISVGWVDTYLHDVPGQVMDVSDLSDGVYALRSIVDPEGLLMESNKDNNDALVYFHLEGSRLTVLPDVRFARSYVFRTLFGDTPVEDTPVVPQRKNQLMPQ